MNLRWNDLAATVTVAVIGAISWAYFADRDWPLVDSPRVVTVVAILLGAFAYATCSRTLHMRKANVALLPRLMRTIGLLCLAIAVAGGITGSDVVLIVLIALIMVLWFVAMVRHALTPPPAGVS